MAPRKKPIHSLEKDAGSIALGIATSMKTEMDMIDKILDQPKPKRKTGKSIAGKGLKPVTREAVYDQSGYNKLYKRESPLPKQGNLVWVSPEGKVEEAYNHPLYEERPLTPADLGDKIAFVPVEIPGMRPIDVDGEKYYMFDLDGIQTWLKVNQLNVANPPAWHFHQNQLKDALDLEKFKRTGPASAPWTHGGAGGKNTWHYVPQVPVFWMDIDGAYYNPKGNQIDPWGFPYESQKENLNGNKSNSKAGGQEPTSELSGSGRGSQGIQAADESGEDLSGWSEGSASGNPTGREENLTWLQRLLRKLRRR